MWRKGGETISTASGMWHKETVRAGIWVPLVVPASFPVPLSAAGSSVCNHPWFCPPSWSPAPSFACQSFAYSSCKGGVGCPINGQQRHAFPRKLYWEIENCTRNCTDRAFFLLVKSLLSPLSFHFFFLLFKSICFTYEWIKAIFSPAMRFLSCTILSPVLSQHFQEGSLVTACSGFCCSLSVFVCLCVCMCVCACVQV